RSASATKRSTAPGSGAYRRRSFTTTAWLRSSSPSHEREKRPAPSSCSNRKPAISALGAGGGPGCTRPWHRSHVVWSATAGVNGAPQWAHAVAAPKLLASCSTVPTVRYASARAQHPEANLHNLNDVEMAPLSYIGAMHRGCDMAAPVQE